MASELLAEISKFGMNLLDTNTPQHMNYTLDYSGKLVRAIEDDRTNHINYEKNYTMSNYNATQLGLSDSYVTQQIINSGIDTTNNSFVLDTNNNVIAIPSATVVNETPAEILKLAQSQSPDAIQPYVYSVDPEGKLVKLYVFDSGSADLPTNPEDPYIEMMTKQFEISFFKDINILARYIIDTTNGISIKLNLNDPLIDKYLVTDTTTNIDNMTIASITSTQALIFLREMIVEIFADLIIQNDLLNNILILDSTNYNNLNKLSAYRQSVINRIEVPIDNIFDTYVATNINQKHSLLLDTVDMVGKTITGDPTVTQSTIEALTQMRAAFEVDIKKLVE